MTRIQSLIWGTPVKADMEVDKTFDRFCAMRNIKVSLIVPTFNRRPELARLLNSIFSQDTHDYETIVIDNGSSDGTAEYLQSLQERVTVISNVKNLGAAYAKNQGIKKSNTDLVWFLDSDSEFFDNGVIARALDVMNANPDIGALGGEINLDADGRVFYRVKRFLPNCESKNIIFRDMDIHLRPCDHLPICNCVARKELLYRWGGFDPAYFVICEDDELGIAINSMGYSNVYDSRATVIHHIAKDGRDLLLSVRNRVRLVLLNMNIWRILLLPFLEIISLFRVENLLMLINHGENPHIAKYLGQSKDEQNDKRLIKRLGNATGFCIQYCLALIRAYFHNLLRIRSIVKLRRKRPDYLAGIPASE